MILTQYGEAMRVRRVFEQPLDDAAAVGMGGQGGDLVVEGVDDEEDDVRWTALDTLLDDVVTVRVCTRSTQYNNRDGSE